MTAEKTDPIELVDIANRAGRPRVLQPTPETLKLIRGIGRLQCTTKEGASFFSVAEPTYLRFLKDFPEAAQALEDGKGEGKMSLRRTQFKLAERNAAMAIFLGKQHLAQRDIMRNEHTGANGGPIATVDLASLSDEELETYERLCLKLGASVPSGRLGDDQGGEGETPIGEEPC